MANTRRLNIRPGMRLMRQPGALVLEYRDERVPCGEPLVVVQVSRSGSTATLWLEFSRRVETVHLSELVVHDFIIVDEQVTDPWLYKGLAASYIPGQRLSVELGTILRRTGLPLRTFDHLVPYVVELTVTDVQFEEFVPGAPSKDFVNFQAGVLTGFINGHDMTDAYFVIVK